MDLARLKSGMLKKEHMKGGANLPKLKNTLNRDSGTEFEMFNTKAWSLIFRSIIFKQIKVKEKFNLNVVLALIKVFLFIIFRTSFPTAVSIGISEGLLQHLDQLPNIDLPVDNVHMEFL